MLITEILKIYNRLIGFEGHKSIAGTVMKQGVPDASMVRCYEKASGLMVAQVRSAEDGTYQFFGLSENYKYFIVSFDSFLQFNAVIQDNVVPK